MKHAIVGYDIRMPKDVAAANWNENRRKEYLLRTNIQCPLSVDIDVWPSVFALEVEQSSNNKLLIAEPSIMQEALGLWEDWREMVRRFRSATESSVKCQACAICITVLSGERSKSPFLESWAPVLGLASQRETTQADWVFLGFDIADRNLLSGLSNCGYDQRQADAMRVNWANRLNDDGLFFGERDAVDFRQLSDDRGKEHSPFDVFGLFSIQLNSTCQP